MPNVDRPSVLVLMGGPDAEREVSLHSGAAIARALRECGSFDVLEQVIDRPDAEDLRGMPGDVIFPALHGAWGEGGPLQSLLEQIGRRYVGSRPPAAALAMDKLRTKSLLLDAGLPTPASCELAGQMTCPLPPPLVLKPVDEGSSVDIRICQTSEQVDQALRELTPRRARLMAEQFIPGREMTVAIITGEAYPVIEIVPGTPFYDYEAKYLRDDTTYTVDPDINSDLTDELQSIALKIWELVGCRHLARVDFRVDPDNRPWCLEINTMPGFTDHSLVPMAAAHRGLSMATLCEKLVRAALSDE